MRDVFCAVTRWLLQELRFESERRQGDFAVADTPCDAEAIFAGADAARAALLLGCRPPQRPTRILLLLHRFRKINAVVLCNPFKGFRRFLERTLLREMEDRGEDGYAIVADYMASLTTANREYRLRELKMSGRSPYSSSLYAKYSGDMPAWAFLELTSFGTLIDFVRFCARRWGDRRLEASHYDLKRVKSVRNCAAHGSCLINCFAERGAARGSASSGVSRRVAAVGIPKATRRKWMGNTAMQEVATVLVAHSGLVPEGSSRSRAASELAEMFARADGETEALPDKGPDAAARSALEFLRRLTESLGLVE